MSKLLEKENIEGLEEYPSINAREARSNFSKIIREARYGKNKVIITDHGEPAVGLVSIDDVRILDLFDRLDIKSKIKSGDVKHMSAEEFKSLFAADDDEGESGYVQRSKGGS